MEGLYFGKLRITPTNRSFDAFDYPNGDVCGYFFVTSVDGVSYFYTGKSRETASRSFPASIVEVVHAQKV